MMRACLAGMPSEAYPFVVEGGDCLDQVAQPRSRAIAFQKRVSSRFA